MYRPQLTPSSRGSTGPASSPGSCADTRECGAGWGEGSSDSGVRFPAMFSSFCKGLSGREPSRRVDKVYVAIRGPPTGTRSASPYLAPNCCRSLSCGILEAYVALKRQQVVAREAVWVDRRVVAATIHAGVWYQRCTRCGMSALLPRVRCGRGPGKCELSPNVPSRKAEG